MCLRAAFSSENEECDLYVGYNSSSDEFFIKFDSIGADRRTFGRCVEINNRHFVVRDLVEEVNGMIEVSLTGHST